MATFKNNRAGVIVIIASLSLAVILLLGSYFLAFSLTESKIARSQEVATRAYYLSEAGVNEAIWKLKNDSVWKNGFEQSPGCLTWGASFIRNYDADSTTLVSIQNSRCAEGEITATSTIALAGGNIAQRVVKVGVLRALEPLTEDSPVFAGSPSGESAIQASNMNVHGGNIFVNNNLKIQFSSAVNVYDNPSTPESEGKVLAAGNLIISGSTLNSDAECSKNTCNTIPACGCDVNPEDFSECSVGSCPPISFGMPAIDFSSDEPSSYKSKAQAAEAQGQCSILGFGSGDTLVLASNKCFFSESEFEDLLWQVGEGGKLVLEHKTNGLTTSIYYVGGNVDLMGARRLEINGVLVSEKTINVGEKMKWKGDSGFNQIVVNDPGAGFPSGILSQSKMNFGSYASFEDTNITGIIYAEDEIRMTSLPNIFNVVGGIIARKFSLVSAWSPLNIYLDNDIILEGVWGGLPSGGTPPYSPIVTIEHWEESY